MKIVFRADASLRIGTGHIMRCLTLADALRARGHQCQFICRAHPGHLAESIQARGHAVTLLPMPNDAEVASTLESREDQPRHAPWLGECWQIDAAQTRNAIGAGAVIDWLIVDHYALDRQWEQGLRPSCRKLMVIDDLADRPHDCDLLLDQNLGRQAGDYACWVTEHCTALIGPQYALLRPGFAKYRPESLARRNLSPVLHQLLISMGGVDEANATGAVLDALRIDDLPASCRIVVVMGPHAPWLAAIRHKAQRLPWPTEVLIGVHDMARLMRDSDLAIGAAGSTSWERCCLGLPTILVVLADNQRSAATALHQADAVALLGERTHIKSKLHECLRDASARSSKLSDLSSQLCAGEGTEMVCERIEADHAL